MSHLRSLIEGSSDVLDGLVADRQGHLREPPASDASLTEGGAATGAVAIAALDAAGAALGLKRLQGFQVKGEQRALLAVVRGELFVLAAADPRRVGPAQTLLEGWQPAAGAAAPAPAGRAIPSPRAAPLEDAWTRLRRALVRGQLAEAASCQPALDEASAAAGGRPGTEALPASERERALAHLLDGVGSVLAGDGRGGGLALREVADPGQRNQSLRWLALHWSVRAGIRSGALAIAGNSVKEALALAKQLDEDARAATQVAIGDLLPHGKDPASALPWLADARVRFERLGDARGAAQALLGQARILALLDRGSEATDAARQACAADGHWDEPLVFLASRALQGADLAAAEQLVRPFETVAADRLRALVDAVRQGIVSQADVVEYLRERDAPARARSIRALERIARAAPRFAPAREALAWMLVNTGRHADAAVLFRGLLTRELAPAEHASVMLGLGCVASAEKAGQLSEGGPSAAAGTEATPPSTAGAAASVSTALPSPEPAPAATPPPAGASSEQPATGPASAGTVFSGEFSALALPDLLEFLRTGRRTGLLVCTSAQGQCALRFADGHITSATSPATPRIAQVLAQSHAVTPEALGAAAGAIGPDPDDRLLCEHLLREGLVQSVALEEALSQQVDSTMRELLRWKEGAFVFDRGPEGSAARAESPVAVDVQGTLMRLFQEQDEASRDVPAPADVF